MGRSEFRFKQFSISQEQSSMKVGTDGVLLGAWVNLDESYRRILDIGTGTGVISIMLAQRAPKAHICGVDIESVAEAAENVARSPWPDRIEMVQSPIQRYEADRFDLIVTNPPYFVQSLLSPDAGRTTARHTISLPFEELRDAMDRLLTDRGRVALILPCDEALRFEEVCRGLFGVVRRTTVRTTPRHPAKRVLLEMCRCGVLSGVEEEQSELMIGTGVHEEYTPEYRRLTGDFYLKF